MRASWLGTKEVLQMLEKVSFKVVCLQRIEVLICY